MNKQLIMMGLAVTLVSGGYVLAAGEHQMPDGTVMDDQAMEAESVTAPVEIGNKICPISGGEIGSMGEGYPVEHEGKSYKLCCEGCLKDFEKDPAKYSKMADEEVKSSVQQ